MINKILALFKSKDTPKKYSQSKAQKPKRKVEASRIGELGEHKINIQLDQLPKECKYLSDLMLVNKKSRSDYSQIDHVIISPYGLFVIETKNYNGTIKGTRDDRNWTVNGRFRMYNPLKQNYGHIKALENVLSAYSGIRFISIISFTARCRFSIDPELRKIESDELVIYDIELTEYINRKINRIKATSEQTYLTENELDQLFNIIQASNITDPALRAEHIKAAKG